MKNRLFKVAVLILTFSFFTACNSESYMDISSFVRLYTKYADEKIAVEDFILKETDGENVYCAFFPKDNPYIVMKITADDSNIISSAEIYMPKTDEKGENINITEEEISLFLQKCKGCLMAYSFLSAEQAENILNEMLLYSKSSYENTGELTKTYDSYRFVYYSTKLSSEFVITNTYIKEIEETNKPESRPVYGSTTNIRTETVPLE